MNQNWMRFGYVCEFLLAMATIFTAWPEIGSEAALEVMPWAVKLGLGAVLSACLVGYTKAIVEGDKLFTGRAIRWLAGLLLLLIGLGVVTYYYTLVAESTESDEPSGTVSIANPNMPRNGAYS